MNGGTCERGVDGVKRENSQVRIWCCLIQRTTRVWVPDRIDRQGMSTHKGAINGGYRVDNQAKKRTAI